jgi:D-Tyr-tRNAtyr deacylase
VDLATLQWVGGVAVVIILGLVGWIAKDNNEKMKEMREDIATLRNLMDSRAEKLHERINEAVGDVADVRETLAGFQGTFMTREEHGRYCQQMQQHQPRA